MNIINHPFHLVNPSPWPLTNSLSVIILLFGILNWIHTSNTYLITIYLSTLILTSTLWWRDIIRESYFTYQGLHTKQISSSLKLGTTIFIVSEIFFFISFFRGFFHSSLFPTHEIGLTWPPEGLKPINLLGLPLLNTTILICSGVMITLSHYNLILNNILSSQNNLSIYILLGIWFNLIQINEYQQSLLL